MAHIAVRLPCGRATLLAVGQFKDISTQDVVTPPEYQSGDVIYPYANAK